jgi:molybdate transport system substrate-binding protein
MKKLAVAVSLAAALLLAGAAARADELKVLSSPALQNALKNAGANFERMTGIKLAITYEIVSVAKTKFEKGEPADVVVLDKPAVAALVKAHKIVADSVRLIARSDLAIGVRKGQPKPDISSLAAFKKTLLAAKSIAYFDPKAGFASGVEFARVLARLGVAKTVGAKAKLWKSLQEQTDEKDADLVVGLSPALQGLANYDWVGLLPAPLQDAERSAWAAGAATKAADLETAKDFVRVLASPESLGAFKAKGFTPP